VTVRAALASLCTHRLCTVSICLHDLTRLWKVGNFYRLLSGEGADLHPVLSAVLFLSLICADVA
jgi:hypothetical protein